MSDDGWEYLPDFERLPDLTHWKVVPELTIEQAALLMAGIEPNISSMKDAVSKKVPRSVQASTYALGIVGAIRSGLLQPIHCVSLYEEWNEEYPRLHEIEHDDRKHEIAIDHTYITRNAWIGWMNREKIVPIAVAIHQINRDHAAELRIVSETHKSKAEEEKVQETILLAPIEHKSEGIDYCKMVVK